MHKIAVLWIGCIALVGGAIIAAAAATPDRPQFEETAPIVLLVDVQSGQTLLAHNSRHRFIPASIAKVMSCYVAFDMLADGTLSLQQRFALSEAAAKEWYQTGSTMFLEPGEEVTVDTLIKGISSISANDASMVLAEGATGSVDQWVALMNGTAQKLGMRDSHFGTPNGWPDGGGTFTTARDLEILAKAMIAHHPDRYAQYFGKSGLEHNGIAQENHDPISDVIAGADGIKTGYTNQAGHGFLGSAERAGTRLIMVIAGIDTANERARIAREIMEWGFTGFDRRTVYSAGTQIARAQVQNGSLSEVGLLSSDEVTVVTPVGYHGDITLNLVYKGPLKAPILRGETVAELEILTEGLPPARVPLLASESVSEASAMQRIHSAFHSWIWSLQGWLG